MQPAQLSLPLTARPCAEDNPDSDDCAARTGLTAAIAMLAGLIAKASMPNAIARPAPPRGPGRAEEGGDE